MQGEMDDSVSSFSLYVFIFRNMERRMDLDIKTDFVFLPLFSVIRVVRGCIFSECFLIDFVFVAEKPALPHSHCLCTPSTLHDCRAMVLHNLGDRTGRPQFGPYMNCLTRGTN